MKRIVFCDFDGTITIDETFVAMLKRFAPNVSAQILPTFPNNGKSPEWKRSLFYHSSSGC
jgi:2-hydroxy-3-keto-5-methylthiopentenyl-1-phosphate phosphatase